LRILIIRPGAIGDTLLTLPVIEALRARYNAPHITLVGNAAVLPLALASGLVEEVSDYGLLQWSELFSTEGIHAPTLLEQLQQIDLAICWLRDPDGLVERNLRLAGVRRIIAAPGRPLEGKGRHIVDYLAETVGLKESFKGPRGRLLAPPPIAHAADNRDEGGLQADIAIHPGSGGAEKCWPAACFAAVIERLWQRNYSVLLLAGPADQQRINDLQSYLLSSPDPGMFKALSEAPLTAVAEHLQHCRCYLGNDSGISHLAAMLGVRSIVLFGPSNPATWRPVGPSVEIIQAPALELLPVDVVMESILLSREGIVKHLGK
jgi:heptosyltransferase III